MLTPDEVKQYLSRMNCLNISNENSLQNLNQLHENHIMTFSFGSASIQDKCFISENPNEWFTNLVINQHSGVCYELNYNFHRLLKTLGYKIQLSQAQVCLPDTSPNNWRLSGKFTHLLNIVTIDNTQYIAEVGTIDSIRVPIELKNQIIQQQDAQFEVRQLEDNYLIIRTKRNKHAIMTFDLIPRQISEFTHLIPFYNHDPHSLFQHHSFVTRKDKNGYRMIKGSTYKILDNVNPANSSIRENLTAQECLEICQKDFGLEIKTYNPAPYIDEPDESLELIEIII